MLNKKYKYSHKFQLLYPIYFLLISIILFICVFFLEKRVTVFLIVIYFILAYLVFLFRYLIVLKILSTKLEKKYSQLYKKNKGISNLISPLIIFNPLIRGIVNTNTFKYVKELKLVIVLLILSFLNCIFLSILVCIS